MIFLGTRTADVVAKADDMAKRIEEESKKVEDQSNVIASEIEARSKTIEDASQEKKFEEASKHVDNVMDEGEKEVDDRGGYCHGSKCIRFLRIYAVSLERWRDSRTHRSGLLRIRILTNSISKMVYTRIWGL